MPSGFARADESPAPRVNYTTYSDEQLAAALQEHEKRAVPDWCGVAVPLTHQMVTRGTFSPQVALLETYADMMCGIDEKRWPDAYRSMIALERYSGERIDFGLGVPVAFLAGSYDAAEERLFAYLDAADRPSLTDDEARVIWNLARTYDSAKLTERSLSLFRALSAPERFAKFSEEDRDAIGSKLFLLEAEAGNIAAASEKLGYLKSPYSIRSALADRRLAPLWPQVGAMAGPNMALTLNARVDRAKLRFDAAPTGDGELKELAEAYLTAGRFADVVALVAAKEPAPDDYGSLTENMGWALNAKVYALDALGRHEEAEAIFDRIAGLKLDDRTRGWLVNFVINRALRLVDRGDAGKALPAIDLADRIATEAGSDYARMLVRGARMCALRESGRAADLAPLLAEVSEHAAEAPAEAAEAMLCADADDQAAKVVRDALTDPARSAAMIEALQSRDFGLYYGESNRPQLFERIRKRRDVASLFDKVGRDIPREFVPLFTLRLMQARAARAAE